MVLEMLETQFEKIVAPYEPANKTPAGYDLTIGDLYYADNPNEGITDLRNKTICKRTEPMSDIFRSYIPVIVETKEIIKMPADCTAIAVQRSTLNRCGAFFNSAVIDAGYIGTLRFLVLPTVPIRLRVGDRIAQLIVFKHAPVEKLYDGTWQYQGMKQ